MITIVDYGMGNLGSIVNMMRRIGLPATLTSDPDAVTRAERLVLPGVGAFDQGMRAISAGGLREAVVSVAQEGRQPVLGLCLGMQLLLDRSEEGQSEGLGLIRGDVRRLRPLPDASGRSAKVPHMGWNHVLPVGPHPLFEGHVDDLRFYFVHGYYAVCAADDDVLAGTVYGGQPFASVIARGNVAGVQFHPEKSHRFGMQLFRNFAAWRPA